MDNKFWFRVYWCQGHPRREFEATSLEEGVLKAEQFIKSQNSVANKNFNHVKCLKILKEVAKDHSKLWLYDEEWVVEVIDYKKD